MSTLEGKQTRAFQTEVRQLLDLMIHSLYSNKEIFLRELISNASDAADKLRFEAIANDGLYEGDAEVAIRITFDKEANTLTISDNGIGMSAEEVEANIGTIARSGTREFLQSLQADQAKDANLIGQFGVGFYSAFIVADRVTLLTRRAGLSSGEAVRWESAGDGVYTLENIDKPARGTDVILHLKAEEKDFLDDWRLRSTVRKFSDHVPWPILMLQSKGFEPEEEEAGEETKPESDDTPQWDTVNKASALWTRAKSEITEEEYNAFYKHVGHDFEEPLAHIHARLEGKYEYTVLLYVPKRAPYDLWDRDRKHGVKLYVRRVFIMEGAEDLMPRYLRFVRGVVDSTDLPLNVSREILQKNPAVDAIKKGMTGKIFSLLEDLAKNDAEKYQTFWDTFGVVLKEGVIEDFAHRERVAKLLRFSSTHADSKVQDVSLEAYVSRMREKQKAIYFVNGESFEAARHHPHLEVFRKKGIEVLLLSDRVDEWLVTHLHEFDGKPLQSVAKGGLDLGELEDEADKQELEKQQGEFKDLLERVQKGLGEQVKEVRITNRLTDSPSCLVSGEHDLSASMERILREAGQKTPDTKRTLELNPSHPLVGRLKGETNDQRFDDLSHVLFAQALLSEGGQLEDPAEFVRRLNGLLLG
ncbi:Chaperone protein HtpG [Candidatus Magnetaquicoccaceae bacterium FCR-1]|uniref:Chaperone protein HtpG n=1 Tax=Candidatus Magnetaquiglobus chichijimensis TaxID=3141448 RepID=A0ABQ0C6E3_9PROT